MIRLCKQKPSIINELKKTFEDMVHMIPEQMIRDPVGNIHKKYNALKQAEGNHFESFLLYLKKLCWILFQVLASFFSMNHTFWVLPSY